MALNAANKNVTSVEEEVPAPTEAVPATLPTEQTRPESPVSPASNDPRVAELKGMFPTLPSTLISDIIQTHSHPSLGLSEDDVLDRAIGDLLEMSDPGYKAPAAPAAGRGQGVDISLDEQFARSLALQDEQASQSRSQSQHSPSWPAASGGEQVQVPYQPRVRRAPPPASPVEFEERMPGQDYNYRGGGGGYGAQGGQQGGIEEKIEQYAAVGKKTIDSLFTKAKSKFNELQEAQAARANAPPGSSSGNYNSAYPSNTSRDPNAPSPFGTGASGITASLGGLWSKAQAAAQDLAAGMNAPQGQQQQGQQRYDQPAAPGGGRGGRQDYDARLGGWGQQQQQQQGGRKWAPGDEFDDGNSSRSVNVYQPSSSSSSETASPPSGTTKLPPTKPYDIGPSGLGKSPTTSMGLSAGSPGDKSGTSPSGKIDLSKLGMLPKKKVSLLSSSPSTGGLAGQAAPVSAHTQIPQSSARKVGDDVEEEEEYTKNPFDER